mgnify:FL=1
MGCRKFMVIILILQQKSKYSNYAHNALNNNGL